MPGLLVIDRTPLKQQKSAQIQPPVCTGVGTYRNVGALPHMREPVAHQGPLLPLDRGRDPLDFHLVTRFIQEHSDIQGSCRRG